MFKQITIVVLAVAVFVSIAGAQTVKVELSEGSTSVDCFWRGDGAFVYVSGSRNWAETYAGATYSPAPWAEIALGIGLEQADSPIRLGGWVWLGQGDVSFCHLFEDGGSGPWHKTILSLVINEHLKIGALDRSFMGRGAFAEIAISGDNVVNTTVYEGGDWTLSLSHSF